MLIPSDAQTVESLFMLWKTTRDPKWRERAWAVFEALEREARTEAGYAVVGDVQSARGVRRDEMPRCVCSCLSWLQSSSRKISLFILSNFTKRSISIRVYPSENAQIVWVSQDALFPQSISRSVR